MTVIAWETSAAFQIALASSSKLLTWSESESDSHGSCMAVTEMVSVLNCTSNSNGGNAIPCHLDRSPHRLLFSDLMASWYTSKNFISFCERELFERFTTCLHFQGQVNLTSGRVLVLIHVDLTSVEGKKKKKCEWRLIQTTKCRHVLWWRLSGLRPSTPFAFSWSSNKLLIDVLFQAATHTNC